MWAIDSQVTGPKTVANEQGAGSRLPDDATTAV
jgi:hypothetical protein